jgi:hypothetical protein
MDLGLRASDHSMPMDSCRFRGLILPSQVADSWGSKSTNAAALQSVLCDVRPLSSDVQRVQRLARRHKQPIAFGASKADIGADLW